MALVVAVGQANSSVFAQPPKVHYRHRSDLPPGAIGSAQLQRGGPLPGYFQPVEIKAPTGAEISLAAGNRFLDPQPSPTTAGLLVGGVYRFRVSRIPYEPGREVFPTVEIIDRLYPPGGQQKRFPIVVEITQEDLELALAGSFVTRVIYLEEPRAALPVAEEAIGGLNSHDAKPGDNPIEIADTLGRPMAILRLGGWLPINNQANGPVNEDLEPGLGTALPLIRYPSPGAGGTGVEYESEGPCFESEAEVPAATQPRTAGRIPAALPIGAKSQTATASHEAPAPRKLFGWRGR
ncbi:MAG: hypothetical protein JNG90_04665 [Planctomycetaceae bacterium]|nr:hypothetical protein [Planctomycetaceae bacterium]